MTGKLGPNAPWVTHFLPNKDSLKYLIGPKMSRFLDGLSLVPVLVAQREIVRPIHHVIWHLFVAAAAICHWIVWSSAGKTSPWRLFATTRVNTLAANEVPEEHRYKPTVWYILVTCDFVGPRPSGTEIQNKLQYHPTISYLYPFVDSVVSQSTSLVDLQGIVFWLNTQIPKECGGQLYESIAGPHGFDISKCHDWCLAIVKTPHIWCVAMCCPCLLCFLLIMWFVFLLLFS